MDQRHRKQSRTLAVVSFQNLKLRPYCFDTELAGIKVYLILETSYLKQALIVLEVFIQAAKGESRPS